ncbi:P-loop containing nucleoside triphosphate hydrolase protein [Calycina marina]|uniref:ATP-dependent RNA helicase n=1 Tax=Calycina marina TaxID=1763456 RepID=A0A9P7YXI0_9HELO|nr:P-loop containing nucleoside triphosphate hydrolase protein [Calycina marina]
MATPIYSRYIPAKKAPHQVNTPIRSQQASAIPAIPANSPPPSTPSVYAQYIPPKSITHASKKDSPASTFNSKRKLAEVTSEELAASPKKQKKEKREKREKKDKKQHPETNAIPSEDATTEKEEFKHKGILKKKEKSLRKAEKQANKAAGLVEKEVEVEDVPPIIEELHDLVPLPQPEPVPDLPTISTTSSLPQWLASPIRVSSTDTASFADVGVQTEIAKILEEKGFKGAFAVQAAVLPLLLPGKSQQQGDVLVSAATGSGKTLAYVLPMIENISPTIVTRLRGVIIMPTRELVAQVKEVCEVCATASSHGSRRRVKVGTAVGSENFKIEQASIMEQEDFYDPAGRREQERRLNRKWESSDWGSDDGDGIICDEEPISDLPDHVIGHISKIDILICTPGRLVEHIRNTPGFTLGYVNWLVVDEADKLLDQTFQNWLNIVMAALDKARPEHPTKYSRVRKCVLSATLTRDVGQLNGLKLFRPKLVVLEGSASADTDVDMNDSESGHVLPATLIESAVKADEEGLKPLYLMELLMKQDMLSNIIANTNLKVDMDDSSSDDSSSDDGSIDTSQKAQSSTNVHGVLIFTKSNESAVRLGRFIALLEPKYSKLIGTLTSTTRSSVRRTTIKSFNSAKLSILVASDLVSRGLDLPNLAHVINYDVPTSVTNYVHRVGRTARAGKPGSAWTIFSGPEGAWFWNGIARSKELHRKEGSQVARINVKAEGFTEEVKYRYEAALEELRIEASASSKPKKSKKEQ